MPKVSRYATATVSPEKAWEHARDIRAELLKRFEGESDELDHDVLEALVDWKKIPKPAPALTPDVYAQRLAGRISIRSGIVDELEHE